MIPQMTRVTVVELVEDSCPHCGSDWILPKSNQKEWEGILVCCKCMCHFKKDGTIIKEGKKFEPYNPRHRTKRSSRTKNNRTRNRRRATKSSPT